jgi:tail tube protein
MAFGPTGGTAYFKINGLQYALRGELEIMPNITENEWIANQDLTQTFTQKPVTPYMAMKISDTGGLSIQQLNAVQNVTITAELINGKVYTLQRAAAWGEFKDDTTKGEITGKFGGIACFEKLSP